MERRDFEKIITHEPDWEKVIYCIGFVFFAVTLLYILAEYGVI